MRAHTVEKCTAETARSPLSLCSDLVGLHVILVDLVAARYSDT